MIYSRPKIENEETIDSILKELNTTQELLKEAEFERDILIVIALLGLVGTIWGIAV